ncbi:TetR family transcriptional regulator [Microlunatus sp. Gsoil 973]|nr:TetR family transcriptional regulator [Microlunatus sp. Gsoil 973]
MESPLSRVVKNGHSFLSSGVPKVTEQYRNDRRAEITAAAARCFATRGVHRTSMSDIINESGLSAGAIYNHFRSKQEITVSVAATVIKGRLLGAVEQLEAEGGTVGPGRLIGRALEELNQTSVTDGLPLHRLVIQLWAEAVVDEKLLALMQEQIRSIRASFIRPIKRWAREEHGLSAARAARWSEEISQILIAMASGYVIQRALFPDFDPKKYVADAEKMISGITP